MISTNDDCFYPGDLLIFVIVQDKFGERRAADGESPLCEVKDSEEEFSATVFEETQSESRETEV